MVLIPPTSKTALLSTVTSFHPPASARLLSSKPFCLLRPRQTDCALLFAGDRILPLTGLYLVMGLINLARASIEPAPFTSVIPVN